MSKPTISIYMKAIRPFLWQDLYMSLANSNKTTFEIIFVGHVPPDYVLPENVKYINSSVKPSQCAEIGFRACKGEFCFYASDDMIFSDGCLDLLLDKYYSMDREDVTVCCMHRVCTGEVLPISKRGFIPGRADAPIHPIGSLYKTDLFRALGPRDKNFVCTYEDFDMAMRFYEKGGIAVFAENCIFTEILIPGATIDMVDSGLNWIGKDVDWPLAVSLWMKDNQFLTSRARPVEPFVEEGLLLESQGPKGFGDKIWQ